MHDAYYPEPGAYINDNTNRSACWSAFQVDKNQYEVFLWHAILKGRGGSENAPLEIW